MGIRPVDNFHKKLVGQYQNLYVVGDADKIGRLANTTRSAYKVSKNL
ncbi:hypothetical protein [Maledivibacter halophilus]|nr:hypothetical protein [Maledivibacter halophilus]